MADDDTSRPRYPLPVVIRPIPGRKGPGTAYTPELGEFICQRIADGETLKAICDDLGLKSMTVSGWTDQYPAFDTLYTRARKLQLEAWSQIAAQYATTPTMGIEYEEVSGSSDKGSFTSTRKQVREMLGHRRLVTDTYIRLIGAVQQGEAIRQRTKELALLKNETDEKPTITIKGGLPD